MIRRSDPIPTQMDDSDLALLEDDLEARIRERAYRIFQERGARDPAVDDWLQAEREILYRPPGRVERTRDAVSVQVDVAAVPEEAVEILLAGSRLIVTASPPPESPVLDRRVLRDDLAGRRLFWETSLPLDCEPARLQAGIRGGRVEIEIPLAKAAARPSGEAAPLRAEGDRGASNPPRTLQSAPAAPSGPAGSPPGKAPGAIKRWLARLRGRRPR